MPPLRHPLFQISVKTPEVRNSALEPSLVIEEFCSSSQEKVLFEVA
jgi:hypothetical protein